MRCDLEDKIKYTLLKKEVDSVVCCKMNKLVVVAVEVGAVVVGCWFLL